MSVDKMKMQYSNAHIKVAVKRQPFFYFNKQLHSPRINCKHDTGLERLSAKK